MRCICCARHGCKLHRRAGSLASKASVEFHQFTLIPVLPIMCKPGKISMGVINIAVDVKWQIAPIFSEVLIDFSDTSTH